MLIETIEIVLVFLMVTYGAILLALGLWTLQMKRVNNKFRQDPEALEAYFEQLNQRTIFIRIMVNYLAVMLVCSVLLACTFWKEKPIFGVFLFGWGLFHLVYKYWQKKDQFKIIIHKKNNHK